jgi:hypothetical protein
VARRFERAGRIVDVEFGRTLRLLEKEAKVAARKGKKMQQTARKRSVRLLKRAARTLNSLAVGLERSAKPAKRRRAKRRRKG